MNTGTLEPRERTTSQTGSVDLDLSVRIVTAGPVAASLLSSTGVGTPEVCPSPA